MAQPQPPASLPPGFRFCPTDSELILHYLRRRALGRPLPSAIPDVDLLRHNPWDLLLPAGEEIYLFNYNKAKYGNNGFTNRATPGGHWKVTGRDKPIAVARGAVVGMRRTLVFYRGKQLERTDWIMHEYHLAGACLGVGSSQVPQIRPDRGEMRCHMVFFNDPEWLKFACPQLPLNAIPVAPTLVNAATSVPPAEGWVLCRIFRKKRESPSNAEGSEAQHEAENVGNADIQFIDFLGPAGSAGRRPMSSASSFVTNASSVPCTGEKTMSRGN